MISKALPLIVRLWPTTAESRANCFRKKLSLITDLLISGCGAGRAINCRSPGLAERGIDAKRGKVLAGSELDQGFFLATVDVYPGLAIGKSEDVGEHLIALSELLELRIGEALASSLRIEPAEQNQLLRSFDWQHPQHCCVNHAENGSIRPDAERQREDCDSSEAFVFEQHPRAVTQVL